MAGTSASTSLLDETTVGGDRWATDSWWAFRDSVTESLATRNGELTLTLRPYAYVRIDG